MNRNHKLVCSLCLMAALAILLLALPPAPVSTTYARADDPTATFTPLAWAPTPVPEVPRGEDDLVNILLLGTDLRKTGSNFRTDTIIILSVNRTAQTVSLLSIPRDTYIWLPGWNWARVNTAYWRGTALEWPGGGPGYLAYTLEYNFGIGIDFYASVDFDGFRTIINTLGGVDVVVDCPVSGYKIQSWDLDEADEENYDWVEIPIGVHHMDGDWALWFARWRYSTNDWERNRRQQQLLRAIWQQAREIDIIPRLPELWGEMMSYITTDVKLSDALSLVSVALALDTSRIESHFLGPDQLKFGVTNEGSSVLKPKDYWAVRSVVENVYTPPTQNVLVQAGPSVEVLNGTANPDWDAVAAERLGWEGLVPAAAGLAEETNYPHTLIFDYTGQTKGSALGVLQRVLNVPDARVTVEADPDRTVDYRVILGASYNSCTYDPGNPVPKEREGGTP